MTGNRTAASISVHTSDHYEAQRREQSWTELEIALPPTIFEQIRSHGEQTFPHECCGILLGRSSAEGSVVAEVLPAGNTRLDSAHNRYNIEPIDLIRAQRKAREQALDIVGFYHSHPDHPPFWSPTDLTEAHWYGCSYLITSIDSTEGKPRAHVTNSFLLVGDTEENKAFARQPMRVLA